MFARSSRGVAVVAAVVGLLLLPSTALAAPAPPAVRCEFGDERLAEVSGLVVGPDGPAVVDDSGNPSTVYTVDDACDVARETAVPQPGADVEDLALGPDGTLWLADIGDNRRARPEVAVIRLPGWASPTAGPPVTTRLTYADGPHDAEALVVAGDARPVIVTKDVGGRSGVYTTDRPLPPPGGDPGPVVLRRVGGVALPPSTTPNGSADASALFGSGLITGGALSDDRRVVALRTYTDAWLYPVGDPSADGVVAALRAAPVQVPLPGEPQGEAVAFEPDGTLLSASESPDEVGPAAATSGGALRAVPGAAGLVASTPGTPTPTAPPTAPLPPSQPAAAAPAPDDDGLPAGAWVGIGIAIVAGIGGGLYAIRRERR